MADREEGGRDANDLWWTLSSKQNQNTKRKPQIQTIELIIEVEEHV